MALVLPSDPEAGAPPASTARRTTTPPTRVRSCRDHAGHCAVEPARVDLPGAAATCGHVFPDELEPDASCEHGCGMTFYEWSLPE